MNGNLLSLNQAAKEVGKSPSTISKYLKNGKLSYISKDDGVYKIERSELFRVFPETQSEHVREKDEWTVANTGENTREYIVLEAENKILNERVELKEKEIFMLAKRTNELESERDDWKKQAQTLLLQSVNKPPQEAVEGHEKKSGHLVAKNKKGLSGVKISAIAGISLIAIILYGFWLHGSPQAQGSAKLPESSAVLPAPASPEN